MEENTRNRDTIAVKLERVGLVSKHLLKNEGQSFYPEVVYKSDIVECFCNSSIPMGRWEMETGQLTP